jgi:putative endonuclease
VNTFVPTLLRRLLGDRGEREAARCLRRKGFRILARGYRTRRGEVDLIARDGDTIVFIEVKTRKMGEPAEAVTPEKQRRLTQAAVHFLKRHRLFEHRSRFDVVAIVWPDPHRAPTIEHIHNAFEAVESSPARERLVR